MVCVENADKSERFLWGLFFERPIYNYNLLKKRTKQQLSLQRYFHNTLNKAFCTNGYTQRIGLVVDKVDKNSSVLYHSKRIIGV